MYISVNACIFRYVGMTILGDMNYLNWRGGSKFKIYNVKIYIIIIAVYSHIHFSQLKMVFFNIKIVVYFGFFSI